MSSREAAVGALLARISAAFDWATPPSRRLKLWTDVPASMRPACFLHEGGMERYDDTAAGEPKRQLTLRLFVYVDAHDPASCGASQINTIMDALDAAMGPTGCDRQLGRCTLDGTAYRCSIDGRPMKDPGDLDGDGLLLVPFVITLP